MNYLRKLYSTMSASDLEDLLVISNDLQVQNAVFSELLHREINNRN